MSKYRNIKIHVPTPEISEAVQEKLIEDGCCWEFSGKKVDRTRTPFLYVDKNCDILWGTRESDFNGDIRKEVPYQSILDPLYDVKIAWANEKPIQYSKDGKRWMDWGFRYLLDIRDDEIKWRIKPKTKTIKQWERKYLQGDCVMTMIVSGPDDSNNMECWIGEAYEAEYEVPND